MAAAALAVATLMNAPPGFLEFLLCVPWADLGPLYLRPEREDGGAGELVIPQASSAVHAVLSCWACRSACWCRLFCQQAVTSCGQLGDG